jgi:hypothetical protein
MRKGRERERERERDGGRSKRVSANPLCAHVCVLACSTEPLPAVLPAAPRAVALPPLGGAAGGRAPGRDPKVPLLPPEGAGAPAVPGRETGRGSGGSLRADLSGTDGFGVAPRRRLGRGGRGRGLGGRGRSGGLFVFFFALALAFAFVDRCGGGCGGRGSGRGRRGDGGSIGGPGHLGVWGLGLQTSSGSSSGEGSSRVKRSSRVSGGKRRRVRGCIGAHRTQQLPL